ncbi:hypothetical protein PAXINDRAFT_16984 [Paxillus involutus ATCC 200175]|uniref:Uncharacterized protein n=1 Tax=Paxillus involutus ATCC 200175 TaxID=664439 RepID=A0A0C9TQC5_PAXIN|nr:hypothetical protein PAXINDRAFT_16984 [Paxillus involutus ATCC 200175]
MISLYKALQISADQEAHALHVERIPSKHLKKEPESPEPVVTHPSAPFGDESREPKEDQPLEDVMVDLDHELYNLISPYPPTSPPLSARSEPEDENQPIASSSQVMLEDKDERVEDKYPGAGKFIRMAEPLYQQWRSYFERGGENGDEDIEMEDGTNAVNQESSRYSPFASELDWRVA